MTHYIVINENEIVKAEMERPEKKDYDTGLDFNSWGYASECNNWYDHCLSLPRIPIQGKHNWKVWQEVKEGKDFEFRQIPDGGRSVKSAEGIPYDYEQWFKVVAIPIEQTKSEGAKSELLSVNEAGAIAAKIAETVSPALSAHEQALFVAGFQECIKYLSQQNNLLTNDNPQTP